LARNPACFATAYIHFSQALSNMKSCVIALLVAGAGAMTLTPENWDAETAGKTVLIKFQAPW